MCQYILGKGSVGDVQQIRRPAVGSRKACRGIGSVSKQRSFLGLFLWPSGHTSIAHNLALRLGVRHFSWASLPAKCRV